MSSLCPAFVTTLKGVAGVILFMSSSDASGAKVNSRLSKKMPSTSRGAQAKATGAIRLLKQNAESGPQNCKAKQRSAKSVKHTYAQWREFEIHLQVHFSQTQSRAKRGFSGSLAKTYFLTLTNAQGANFKFTCKKLSSHNPLKVKTNGKMPDVAR